MSKTKQGKSKSDRPGCELWGNRPMANYPVSSENKKMCRRIERHTEKEKCIERNGDAHADVGIGHGQKEKLKCTLRMASVSLALLAEEARYAGVTIREFAKTLEKHGETTICGNSKSVHEKLGVDV